MYTSQGQLLKSHLLKSRLLDTFFQNVNCSTQKVSTARIRFNLIRAVDKKSETARNFEQMTKFLRQ
jgi:hypothetical protein